MGLHSRHPGDVLAGLKRSVMETVLECGADGGHLCSRENEAEEPKDESPKEMTLDEWKAVQDKERAKVEFNIRKANEGADWKKGYVLHKSKKDEVS